MKGERYRRMRTFGVLFSIKKKVGAATMGKGPPQRGTYAYKEYENEREKSTSKGG